MQSMAAADVELAQKGQSGSSPQVQTRASSLKGALLCFFPWELVGISQASVKSLLQVLIEQPRAQPLQHKSYTGQVDALLCNALEHRETEAHKCSVAAMYDHLMDHHAEVESSYSHLWALFAVLAATTAIDFIIFGLGTVSGPPANMSSLHFQCLIGQSFLSWHPGWPVVSGDRRRETARRVQAAGVY